MEKPPETFFVQLKNLAAKIDRECEQYKQAISDKNEEFSAPQAVKDISDMKSEVKQFKAPLQTELDRQKKDVQNLNAIATFTDSLLKGFVSKKITEIEQYMIQYGFKPYEEKSGKENKEEHGESDTNEDNDKETSVPKPPDSKRPVDPNRTPRLEDAGISLGTLQFLNSLQKNKPSANTTVPAALQKPNWSDIPSDFWHNGIICTPSLARSLNADMSYSTDLHSALASPVLLSAPKPMPVIEEKLPDPSGRLLLDSNQTDSPATPVFCTPGIKQILTNTNNKEHELCKPTQSNKRPLNVGLFQQDEKNQYVKPGTRQELNVPDLTSHYDDGEPVEPELTYSLEALTDMTGMFMINPVRKSPAHAIVKPFSARADMVTDNKENATPPEPEMLTDRISKVRLKQDSQLTNNFVPQQTTVSDDMPPSPKLFGNYGFLKH